MNQTATSLAAWWPQWLRPVPESLWAEMRRSTGRPYLHLFNFLWSLWVLATLFFTEVAAAFWWSLAIGYPLFALLFVLVHVRPRAELHVYANLMALLAFVSMFFNPAAWTYVVFACVYTGMDSVQQPKTGVLRMVFLQAILVVLAWWLQWPWFVMLMAVSVCTSSGLGAMFGYMNQLRNRQLLQSHDEVRRLAAAAERERIGRDLHDLLGHTLSLITLKLELSRKLFDRDKDAARRELVEAESVARHALAEVRSAVTGIRASEFAAELAAAKLLLDGSGIAFDYELSAADLPNTTEAELALVLREAVTNIHRHAGATYASAQVSRDNGRLQLIVKDNGRGGIQRNGNGLAGIRERVAALGGTLRIESPAKHGTCLTVQVPITSSESATEALVPESAPSEARGDDQALQHALGGSA